MAHIVSKAHNESNYLRVDAWVCRHAPENLWITGVHQIQLVLVVADTKLVVFRAFEVRFDAQKL